MFYTYSIKNLENGKFYIGSRTRKCMLKRKPEDDLGVKYFSSTTDKELRQAIKDGKVKYTVLQEYDDPQVCWRAEQHLIALYWKFFGKDMSYNHCYSKCETNKVWNTAGTTHVITEETKEKISNAQKGRIIPIEQRVQHSIFMKGRKVTEEVKKKISETMKCRYKTHKHPTTGKTPWNKGLKGNPQKKFYWQTPDGEVKIMAKANAMQFHPDWVLVGEVETNK